MKKSWKRSLSLFLSAVLAGSLLPAAALAEEAAPQPLADTPEYEYVEVTGALEENGVYAIFYDGSNSHSLLYHKGTGTNTDQISGTVNDDGRLSIDTNAGWTDDNALWKFESNEGETFSLKNVATGYYLDLSQSSAGSAADKAKVSQEKTEANALTITRGENGYTVQGTYALMHLDVGSGNKWFYSAEATEGEATEFRIFQQTEVTDPVDPEPEEPATGAPEIPGYTQYTSETLDPSKYYLIVTEDSDGNLYALYANATGAGASPGSLNLSGSSTAQLDIQEESITAAYLNTGETISVSSLHFFVEEGTSAGTYAFRSNGYYLNLNSSMFTTSASYMQVSVRDSEENSYFLKAASTSRWLSFNLKGDGDGYFDSYNTDFWGPNSQSSCHYPIYLYTNDSLTVKADTAGLTAAITNAEALNPTLYTDASWASLQTILEEAKSLLETDNATQSTIDQMTDKLTSAIAALEYVVAPPAELPTATVYQEVTGELEDNGVYAILYDGTSNGSLLYHNGAGSQTDQIGGSVGVDGTLSIDTGSNWTDKNVLWTVKIADGGYTLQNVDTGYYLNLNAANSRAQVSTDPAVVSVTAEDGRYTITNSTLALCHGATGQYYIAEETAASLRFFKMTEVEPERSDGTVPSGTSQGQPFVKADTGSNYFRIPSLITLDNGWIVATADIRWRTSGDAANNLDTIVSISKDGGETWEWEVVNYFDDMSNTLTGSYSACFIDPSVIQASDGTVHMVVDACPSYTGLFNSNMGYESSGFDAQGRMIVALAAADGDAPTDPNAYGYYVDINNPSAGQTISVDGEDVTLYPICSYTDDSETGYFVDAYLDLYYENGGAVEAVYCVQLNGSVAVQSNLFYRQSQWKAYPVFYIMHRSATVTEDGLEWSEPQFLDIKLSSNEAFTGVCPGRGTVAMVDGVERILFPLYDNQTGTELASVIYSDDGGQTWTRGSRANQLNGTGKSSESQIVVLPDGNLRMYSRNTINYISYADSTDGGKTWGAYQQDLDLYTKNPGNGCMVSFINLDGTLTSPDGSVYKNLILASYPVTQRSEGVVRIGSIDAETNEVTWLNDDEVRFSGSGGYAYSCLTQLASLDTFGLLYEYDNTTGTIGYVALTVTDLLGEDWTLAGDEYTITYQITGDYFADDAYATQTVRAGETVTALAAPVQSGYTFHGWTGVPEIMPGHDVTVTGYFTRDSSGVIIPTPPVTTTPDEDEEEIGDEDTPLAELPFTDVAADAWYADAVAYAVEHGLMNGTSASTFSPLMTTDRAMIVTILYRLEGEPAVTGTSAFSDVADGQWYTDAVIWAADNGIVTGYDTGAFGPGDTITREQMAAILYRYASYKGYDVTASADLSGYADQAQISGYALTAMQWANAEGLITGTSDSTLTPGGSATRAEAATILMRFAQSTEG